MPSTRWWANSNYIAVSVIIAAGILFFADALFSSKSFYYRDILNFHYPLRKVLIDSYAQGEFPLWNPHIYLGQPMLANPNYMAFYPTNLLHLILPFNYAFKLHFILHPIAGGLGFFFLARRLGIQWVAALAGALSYEFSGVVLSFLNLYNIVPAVAFVPWLGWAFCGAFQKHALRRTIVLGILLALQVIAFEPLVFQCSLLLLAALAVHWAWEQENRARALRLILSILAGGALLAAGLAAIQILPTLELLPLSARGRGIGLEQAAGWSAHPVDLLNTIIPNFFGYPFTIDASDYWGEGYHESKTGYLVSFFIGSVSLFLSTLSFFSNRKKLRASLLVFSGIGIVLGLGKFSPVYPWLYEHVPLFSLGRYPSKYFLLVSLLVSLLASLGLEAVINPAHDRKRNAAIQKACIVWMIMGILAAGLAFYWNLNRAPLETILRSSTMPHLAGTKNFPAIAASLCHSIRAAGAFMLLSSLLVLGCRRAGKFAALGAMFAILIPLELIPPNLGLAPLISNADIDFVSEADRSIIEETSHHLSRAVSPNILTPQPTDFVLHAPNRSLAWMTLFYRRSGQTLGGIGNGIQYSIDRDIDQLSTRESRWLHQRCLELPPKDRLSLLGNLNSGMVMSVGELRDPRAELLCRFDTHSDLDYRLYRLKDALPRAYFGTYVIRAASAEEAGNRLLEAKQRLGHSLILESVEDPLPVASRSTGRAQVARYEKNRVVCRVNADSAGYLVLLDSYYPGWRATVDGRKAKILRANFAFRAVSVPGGNHTVEFRFVPWTFYCGMAVTLSTILGTGAFCTWTWIRRRRRKIQRPPAEPIVA